MFKSFSVSALIHPYTRKTGIHHNFFKMQKVILLVGLALAVVVEGFVPIPPIAHEIHAPKPYSFGYTIKDKHGEQHREETGDGVGHVKGKYGFTDERGIHREVHYVADKAGFRAEVKTNEHGTAPLNPAAVKMISSAHPYLGGAGLGKGLLPHAPLVAAPVPLAAKPVHMGIAPVAPALVKEGLAFGYGGPLLGGAVNGYDTRFGLY